MEKELIGSHFENLGYAVLQKKRFPNPQIIEQVNEEIESTLYSKL